MYYKRNEPYRFTFKQPVQGTLKKATANQSVATNVKVLDVSNHGAKIQCGNKLQLTKGSPITLSFTLRAESFYASGEVVWINTFNNSMDIGLQLNTDDVYRKSITNELKKIAKEQKAK